MVKSSKSMDSTDLEDLEVAKNMLENTGLAMKLTNAIGRPIEIGINSINSSLVEKATKLALNKSLDIALGTIKRDSNTTSSNATHKMLVTASGFIGGLFGMSSLLVELPLSTTIMLRSIADIAQSQGHNLDKMETRLACLEVFSLGSSRTRDDDASESAYYMVRAGLSYEMKSALKAVEGMSTKAIQDAIARGEMPILIKLIDSIASKFGITVSEKVVAEALPIVGAIGGGGINYIFISHFQQMATGHFIIKRLEKKYGYEVVERNYQNLLI